LKKSSRRRAQYRRRLRRAPAHFDNPVYLNHLGCIPKVLSTINKVVIIFIIIIIN